MPPERSRHHVERAAAGEVCGSPGRVCGPRVRRWACGVGRVAQGPSGARTVAQGAICFARGDKWVLGARSEAEGELNHYVKTPLRNYEFL